MKKKVCLFEEHLKTIKDPVKSKKIKYGNFALSPKPIKPQLFNTKICSPKISKGRYEAEISDFHRSNVSYFIGSPVREQSYISSGQVRIHYKTNTAEELEKSNFDKINLNKTKPNHAIMSNSMYSDFSLSPDKFKKNSYLANKASIESENEMEEIEKKGNDSISKSRLSLRAYTNEITGVSKKRQTFLVSNNRSTSKQAKFIDFKNFKRDSSSLDIDIGYLNCSSLYDDSGKSANPHGHSMSMTNKTHSSNFNYKKIPQISNRHTIQAEIDLLMGKKPKKNIEPKPDTANDSQRKNSSLLSKISKMKQSINIFTKENLFEEVETEEFDNPTYRDYMEDMVLAEYLTKSQAPVEPSSEENVEKTDDKKKGEKEDKIKDKKEKEKQDKPVEVINHDNHDSIADSLIESSMYGGAETTQSSLPKSPQKGRKKKDDKLSKSPSKLNTKKDDKKQKVNDKGTKNEVSNTDVTLFGIFDGHGGYEVSSKAREVLPKEVHSKINLSTNECFIKNLIIDCFEKTDKELMTKLTNCDDMGSTCTLCFITKNKTNRILFCANLGDSHAYLISNIKATRLTAEHKCDNEVEVNRLQDQNAMIFNNRLFGQLALTRAFCDRKMKPHGLIATPAVTSVIIKEKLPSTSNLITQNGDNNENSQNIPDIHENDLYLVLASDGIWDVSAEEDLMRIFVNENKNRTTKELTKILLQHAIESGSTDNISVIVVKL